MELSSDLAKLCSADGMSWHQVTRFAVAFTMDHTIRHEQFLADLPSPRKFGCCGGRGSCTSLIIDSEASGPTASLLPAGRRSASVGGQDDAPAAQPSQPRLEASAASLSIFQLLMTWRACGCCGGRVHRAIRFGS